MRKVVLPELNCFCLDRSQYQLGSLSHMINSKAVGYQDLPPHPEVQPDPKVRNVEVFSKCYFCI